MRNEITQFYLPLTRFIPARAESLLVILTGTNIEIIVPDINKQSSCSSCHPLLAASHFTYPGKMASGVESRRDYESFILSLKLRNMHIHINVCWWTLN